MKDLHEEEVLNLDSPALGPTISSGDSSRSGSGANINGVGNDRTLSRATSTRLAPDEDNTAVDGFGENNFTTVPPDYKGDGSP